MATAAPPREIGRRQFFRFGEWTFTQDNGPDVPNQVHLMTCLGEAEDGTPCGGDSGERDTFDAVREWVRGHVQEHPDHRRFAQLSALHWVMTPEEEPA